MSRRKAFILFYPTYGTLFRLFVCLLRLYDLTMIPTISHLRYLRFLDISLWFWCWLSPSLGGCFLSCLKLFVRSCLFCFDTKGRFFGLCFVFLLGIGVCHWLGGCDGFNFHLALGLGLKMGQGRLFVILRSLLAFCFLELVRGEGLVDCYMVLECGR